jgi:RNA polymerase sigma-70 factor (family 1)
LGKALADNTLISDKELLEQIAQGNTSSLEKLMRRYESKVYQFALKLVKSTELAEEIAQDTFIKIWEKRSELADIDSLSAWLFAITKNKSFNHLKEVAARFMREEVYASEALFETDGETDIHYRDFKLLAASLVDKLPPGRRTIYKMKMEQGLSNEDISNQLNLSPSTVKNQLNKSFQTLKGLLSEHLYLFFILSLLRR